MRKFLIAALFFSAPLWAQQQTPQTLTPDEQAFARLPGSARAARQPAAASGAAEAGLRKTEPGGDRKSQSLRTTSCAPAWKPRSHPRAAAVRSVSAGASSFPPLSPLVPANALRRIAWCVRFPGSRARGRRGRASGGGSCSGGASVAAGAGFALLLEAILAQARVSFAPLPARRGLAGRDGAALDRAVRAGGCRPAGAGRQRAALAGLGENRSGERPCSHHENDSHQGHQLPLPADPSKFDALPLSAAAVVSRPGALRRNASGIAGRMASRANSSDACRLNPKARHHASV